MTSPLLWQWEVDDDKRLAAFELTTPTAYAELGQDVATRFARSLRDAGVQSVTNMLRTRTRPNSVTILWTGEVSDAPLARTVFASYDTVLRALD